jgi:hypothetical protein
MSLHEAKWKTEVNFFKDASFAEFRLSLDAEMKRLKSNGLGSKRKQAQPLSLEEEEYYGIRRFLEITIHMHCSIQ